MKRIFIVWAILLSLSTNLWAVKVIYLKNSAEVSRKDVLLGDLVVDVKLIPVEWAARRVMVAPPAGEVTYHALTAVAYGLSRYEDMRNVTLSGEPVLAISRRARRVEKEEFYQPVLDYLRKTDPWKGSDLDVKMLSISRNTRVPAGETSYQITQVDQKTSKGYSLAHVSLIVDGVEVAEVQVGVEIQLLTDVWVVARNLERGHIIDASDLRSEMHVIDSSGQYVSSKESVVGYEVTRDLPTSDLLRRNAISKPLCAKRGDWVSINAISNNLHITLRAKAMANGRLGDRIMCVNERSLRQVLVELTGSGNGVLVRL